MQEIKHEFKRGEAYIITLHLNHPTRVVAQCVIFDRYNLVYDTYDFTWAEGLLCLKGDEILSALHIETKGVLWNQGN